MKLRPWFLIAALALLALPAIPAAVSAPPAKTDGPAAAFLVPYYAVDTTDPAGLSTLFAVRNESTSSVEITVSYFGTNRPRNQPAQRVETITLAPKRVQSFNIRQTPNLLVDPDGIARGYVVIEAPTAVIQGDYFQLDQQGNFATGDRLVNLDPNSPNAELCRRMTFRFFNGGAFNGGTRFTIWVDTGAAPDVEEPIAFYTVYNEAGNEIFFNELRSNELAFEVLASELTTGPGVGTTNFGAIEFELNGFLGHVAGTLTASNRYSVGFKAVCADAGV